MRKDKDTIRALQGQLQDILQERDNIRKAYEEVNARHELITKSLNEQITSLSQRLSAAVNRSEVAAGKYNEVFALNAHWAKEKTRDAETIASLVRQLETAMAAWETLARQEKEKRDDRS